MSEQRALLQPATPIVASTADPQDGGVSMSRRKRYPAPFYDPQTKKLMKDPVVAPGGITYERSTWESICQEHAEQQEEKSAPAYDNRALKQVIEETLLKNTDFGLSTKKLLLKWQDSVRKSMTKLAEDSVLPTDDPKAVSQAYYCPITMSLMKHPVIGPEGFTFERDAINHWIDDNQVSPLTRTPLPSEKLLYPNLALKEMLKLEATKVEEAMLHPSVREFKLSFIDEEDEEQQNEEPYNGPTTLEEWTALRQQRRKNNAQMEVGGWTALAALALFVLVVIAVGLLLGWLPALCVTFGCCDVNVQEEEEEEEGNNVPDPPVAAG